MTSPFIHFADEMLGADKKTGSIFKPTLRYKVVSLELEPNYFRAWKNNGIIDESMHLVFLW